MKYGLRVKGVIISVHRDRVKLQKEADALNNKDEMPIAEVIQLKGSKD